MTRISVLGAGSFGTALAVHLSRLGHAVSLWARRPELAARLARERINERYLPGILLPDELAISASLDGAVEADLLLMAVPSHGFREVLRSYLPRSPADRELTVISATKGIETETLARMSQVTFEEAVAADRELTFAVISGPSFAAELGRGMPTAAVIACDHEDVSRRLQGCFSSENFRLYRSADVAGVELGGTAKNVIAIAAGLVSGLGLGHNTLAALITRGLHEMTRLGLACGGQPRTFSGLAGLGDLVLTCTGGLSRNRRAGEALAQGRSLWELERETGQVAEGVRNSLATVRLAERCGVEMPISEQMVQVIYHDKPAREALVDLMTRELKSESEM